MYLFAASGGQSGPGLFQALFPFILIFVIFYFIIIMPARKKQKQHQNLIGNLKGGERIVTSGGIFGTVKRVMEDRFEIEVDKGVTMQISKNSVSGIIGPDGAKVEEKKK